MPSCAAIIVTYRTGPRLKECLRAVQVSGDIDQIIIVDNGNPDDLTGWIDRFADKVDKAVLVRPGENLGFGRAVNLGATRAEAEQLLVLNPDCVIRHDAVPALQAAAGVLSSPWIVGGRIFGLDGQNQRGPMRRKLTFSRALARLFGGAGIDLPLHPHPIEPVPMEVISGAFFLIGRDGFTALGGFDEGYFLHVEDIDLCRRANESGGTVVYHPGAGALHYGATSDVSGWFVERHKAAGFARYFRKFARGPGDRLIAELVIPILSAGLFMRALFAGTRGPH